MIGFINSFTHQLKIHCTTTFSVKTFKETLPLSLSLEGCPKDRVSLPAAGRRLAIYTPIYRSASGQQ
ncbi:MAG: hypothetical protein HY063_10585 [Bacteroidetes bacterium]|nr:hypothetical protein [Bacteroidota bacterium]